MNQLLGGTESKEREGGGHRSSTVGMRRLEFERGRRRQAGYTGFGDEGGIMVSRHQILTLINLLYQSARHPFSSRNGTFL